jgi:hypothetical protein
MRTSCSSPGTTRPVAVQTLADLRRIDWSAPWLLPYVAQGLPLAEAALALGSVSAALNQAFVRAELRLPAGPLQAVAPSALPEGQAYEAHIAATACLPTRDGLHDFFNGLMWLHWPALKARLNLLQAAEIGRSGVAARRGPLRDALTLFDENGAWWCGPGDLRVAWRQRQWRDLLWSARNRWAGEVRFRLFGHALMEQLVLAPRPGLTAHGLAFAEQESAGAEPSAMAAMLTMAGADWAAKPFLPLPVAGVPGWWAGQNEAFYGNDRVFRPLRSAESRPPTDSARRCRS